MWLKTEQNASALTALIIREALKQIDEIVEIALDRQYIDIVVKHASAGITD